jgi:protein-glutamine gamma-glutamyltransferase
MHCHRWILLTLFLAAGPSLVHLPWWISCIALLGCVLHYGGRWRVGWYGRIASTVLLALTACGIWLSFDSWFSGDAILSFFIAVVALKWGESETRRDYLLLIFAAVILAAVGALYWETLLSMLHIFVVVLALIASLLAISAGDAVPDKFFIARRAAGLFMLGLPLMVLLFLCFPRIPGPLWDIGVAFGLPVKALMDRGKGNHGMMKTLQPGGIQRVSEDNGNVLVAEFEGSVPFKSRLYWRGPVFWDYDGENWNLSEDWDNRNRLLSLAISSKAKLDRELRWKDNPVRYTLRVMPNGGRWLYGLDVPAAPAPEAFISDEFQLLSIRTIDDREPKLKMLAYLDYAIGSKLTDEQRERALAWPEGSNPRILEAGRELAAQYHTPEDIVQQGLALLATGDFSFDSAHIITPGFDMFDRFFFDEKRGGSEYLAGSFAMLMRAAGVPSRLLSGYRGGTIIALTKFVIVKHADAHAWVEIWSDRKGWIRVEPKDIVLSPGEKDAAQKLEIAEQPDTQVELKVSSKEIAAGSEKEVRQDNVKEAPPKKEKTQFFPSLNNMFGKLQKWVINYNPDRQVELLQRAGIKNSDWRDLMMGAVGGVMSLLSLYLTVAWWRGRKQVDQVGKAWKKFCDRLAKLDCRKKEYECPRDFLKRLSAQHSELAAAAEDITNRYIDIRYGTESSADAVILLQRQVQRFVSMT